MDRRDRAAAEGRWYDKFDAATMTATVSFENDDGDEVEVEITCKFDVCGTCEGRGSHVNPSIDSRGITSEEWDRDWDDEGRAAYLSGAYDVPCVECDGLRVVPVADEAHLDDEGRKALAGVGERRRWRVEDARIARMERGEWQ